MTPVDYCYLQYHVSCVSQYSPLFFTPSFLIRDIYSHHGRGTECVKLFEEMRQLNLQPTLRTFTSLLTGCSHAGLVEEGLRYFKEMQDIYAIPPSIEHFNSVVDLLGRSNRLEEAEQFILAQIPSPNVVTWRTLLGACRIGRAKRVLEQIMRLNPSDASAYVLMPNICAASDDHVAAQQVREEMIRGGVKKVPGISEIEVDGIVHSFYVNDSKHCETGTIYAEIERMKTEMQAADFSPDVCFVLHDVDEETKKNLLWYHSEKLAIAYGMLHIPAPSQ